MYTFLIVFGKFIQKSLRIFKFGGSALPGKIIEKICPNFNDKILSKLPKGIVVISGTNGKTTTTKIVSELLEGLGLRVFTNPSGSNFTYGITAAIIESVNLNAKLNADIAVLELDEAYAVNFVKKNTINYSLLLNVFRDQLDRFAEIDNTAQMLKTIAVNTKKTTVLNIDDPRVCAFSDCITGNVGYFSICENLKNIFINDDDMYCNNDISKAKDVSKINTKNILVLEKIINKKEIALSYNNSIYNCKTSLVGTHNLQNLTAAIMLVKEITNKKVDEILPHAKNIKSAFGRGEIIDLKDGSSLSLFLVKNPCGFRSALTSYEVNNKIMIAINDNYADGRDVSWLWDVDFSKIRSVDVVTGTRCSDMSLRLLYDLVKIKQVSNDIKASLDVFLQSDDDKQIFCTYTAMLLIRKLLSKKKILKSFIK